MFFALGVWVTIGLSILLLIMLVERDRLFKEINSIIDEDVQEGTNEAAARFAIFASLAISFALIWPWCLIRYLYYSFME